MRDRLSEFIAHARQKGLDFTTIFLLLKSAGWKDKEVTDAIAANALTIAVPEPAGMGSARDAFLHLLAFTALYAWVISLIYLLFTYIEFALPDPAKRATTYVIEQSLSSIRVALATLMVSYPLFLLVWGFLLREIRMSPELALGIPRRWLAFLSLFVGAVTIMCDLITVIYFFVEGDLTILFLLKVAVLFLITAALFVYLAMTLRSEGQVEK